MASLDYLKYGAMEVKLCRVPKSTPSLLLIPNEGTKSPVT